MPAGVMLNCNWTYDEIHDKYDTDCGCAYQLLTGGLAENNYRHCPNCGAKIALVALESNHVLQND
jgi:hypothetical protein